MLYYLIAESCRRAVVSEAIYDAKLSKYAITAKSEERQTKHKRHSRTRLGFHRVSSDVFSARRVAPLSQTASPLVQDRGALEDQVLHLRAFRFQSFQNASVHWADRMALCTKRVAIAALLGRTFGSRTSETCACNRDVWDLASQAKLEL